VRGRRLAVEHVLGMLAAGDTSEVILEGYPWLEPEDIRACLVYARRLVGHQSDRGNRAASAPRTLLLRVMLPTESRTRTSDESPNPQVAACARSPNVE
jgi:hypothetical protein